MARVLKRTHVGTCNIVTGLWEYGKKPPKFQRWIFIPQDTGGCLNNNDLKYVLYDMFCATTICTTNCNIGTSV